MNGILATILMAASNNVMTMDTWRIVVPNIGWIVTLITVITVAIRVGRISQKWQTLAEAFDEYKTETRDEIDELARQSKIHCEDMRKQYETCRELYARRADLEKMGLVIENFTGLELRTTLKHLHEQNARIENSVIKLETQVTELGKQVIKLTTQINRGE